MRCPHFSPSPLITASGVGVPSLNVGTTEGSTTTFPANQPGFAFHSFFSVTRFIANPRSTRSDSVGFDTMAYHHNTNDPYYAQPSYPPAGTGVGQIYPPPTGGHSARPPPQQHQQSYEPEYESNWDATSYKSSHYGSQAHLDPYSQQNGYQMSQVNVHNAPPVPMMPYNAAQPNYPPAAGHPAPMLREQHTGSTAGYSAAREKLMKRRSVRHVELQDGNLVLDVQVPSHIVPKGDTSDEMNKMRYTAATCDPDDFMRSKYFLRPYLYGRHTELFIVMTMYNEDEVLFCRTMNA